MIGHGQGGSREQGSGTVLALALVCVVLLAAMVVAGIGTAVVVRHRAAAAADAAALAAATTALAGATNACELAQHAARAGGSTLQQCRLTGPIADVRVVVAVPRWLRWAGAAVLAGATLNARAGPADITQ